MFFEHQNKFQIGLSSFASAQKKKCVVFSMSLLFGRMKKKAEEKKNRRPAYLKDE